FDLYCRMLAEAVEELKALQTGETRKKEAELTPSIALPVTAYLPEEYVPRLNSRLSLYRRLAGIRHVGETTDMAQELRDRFGALPQPVDNLLQLVEIKVLAAGAGVESIHAQGKQVVLNMAHGKRADSLSLPREYTEAIRVSPKQIRLDTRRLGSEWRGVLRSLLEQPA
ncbi:MAG: hypothetical protein KAU10_05720, partial [Dehalococcoidia bacterium]|nr:hypothetical protein [Dehalococcoidia bacterium]